MSPEQISQQMKEAQEKMKNMNPTQMAQVHKNITKGDGNLIFGR